jgi:triacylglycerol lipase
MLSVCVAKKRLPAESSQYSYLFVKGWLGNLAPGYFGACKRHLKNSGLHAKIISVDTQATTLSNAKRIRDAVLKVGKPVVLIGHSKGGIDSAAALSIYPDLRTKVRGLICMQSPFAGSPIATDLCQ